MGTSTKTRLPVAEPVEDYLWCTECGIPHEAELVDGIWVISDDEGDPCHAYDHEHVLQLPKDWEHTYYAHYASGRNKGYDLQLKRPKALPCHCPMYFLNER